MIALDVVILFALTAHWADASLEDEETVPAAVGAHSHAHRPEPRTGTDAHPAPST
jgi:hypothetical protein